RVRVRVVLALAPEHGVPVLDMRKELSIFQNLDNPNRWQGPFRGSPNEWKTSDAEAIIRALQAAEANPVDRPLGRLGKGSSKVTWERDTSDDLLSIPEDEEPDPIDETAEASADSGRIHSEIQYMLLKLGADMGFDVHVARNDQSQIWNGHRLGDMPRRRAQL